MGGSGRPPRPPALVAPGGTRGAPRFTHRFWQPAVLPVIFGVDVASLLLGGLAADMVLFIVSVGLSITMGLMGFVNLAHGGFAMLGGYTIVLVMKRGDVGFMPALVIGFIGTAIVSAAFERLLYSRLYRASELDQVLF